MSGRRILVRVVGRLNGSRTLVGGSQVVLELFAPDTGEFTAVDSALPPHVDGTATRLADGRVLLTGGLGGENGPALSHVAIFDPAADAVEILDLHLAPARFEHAATLLADGRVLLSGGRIRRGYDAERLTDVLLFE